MPATTAPRRDPLDDDDDVLVPGELVGEHLRVEGLIGRGGMGVVYLARDLQLERLVAIKLHREHTGADAIVRLEREARAMARVAHPNVAAVHEVGVHRGRAFIAMELIGGGTARSWRAAAPRSLREIVALWLQAARGLAAAHAAGLVHGDFKPDNVLLGEPTRGSSSHGRVRVADFGLVRTRDEPTHDTIDLALAIDDAPHEASAATDASLGTPGYRAPELAHDAASPASDQYAFCVALHEAVLGRLPEGAGATSLGTLPRWLRHALERGRAESPYARWPTMDALIAALERGLGARRRRGLAAAMGFAAAGSIAVGVAVGAWPSPCADAAERIAVTWSDERRDAIGRAFAAADPTRGAETWSHAAVAVDDWVHAWVDARDASCRATRNDHVQDERVLERSMGCFDRRAAELAALLDSLAVADELAVRNASLAVGELGSVRACTDETLLLAEVEPPDDADTLAAVERVRARLRELAALRTSMRLVAATTASEGLREDAEATGYEPLRAEALLELGSLAAAEHRATDALALLEEAHTTARSCGDEDTAANAARTLARTAVSHGDPEMAQVWLELARADLARGTADPDLAVHIERTAGVMHTMRSEFDDAIACFERALELASARPGEHILLAIVREELAATLGGAGRLHEACEAHRAAIATYDRVLGPDSPQTAIAHTNHGMDLVALGRVDEGIAEHRLALTMARELFAPDNPMVAHMTLALAGALVAAKRHEEAAEHARRALAMIEANGIDDAPERAVAMQILARCAFRSERYDESLDWSRRTLAVFRKRMGDDAVPVAQTELVVGHALFELGRLSDARTQLRTSLATWERGGNARHPNAGSVWALLARTELGLAHWHDAAIASRQALLLGETGDMPPFVLASARCWNAIATLAEDGDVRRARELAEPSIAVLREAEENTAADDCARWLEHPPGAAAPRRHR